MWTPLILVFFSLLITGNPIYAQQFEINIHPVSTTFADEYAPFLSTGNKLLYCSNQRSSFFKTTRNNAGELVASLRKFEGGKTSPTDESSFLTGPATYQKGILIYTRASGNQLSLYLSTTGTPAPDDQMLPFCQKDHNYAQPFLSVNADTLWFASDMPGGEGDCDIWYAATTPNGWGEPVNAGPSVNSAAMEIFPTRFNNVLYFSSNREGNFDLYCKGENQQADKLPEPINSSGDDISIFWTSVDKGLLASNRNGTDDIFYIKDNLPPCPNVTQTTIPELCYTFFEESGATDDDFPLGYEWEINGEKFRGNEVQYCFSQPGSYEVQLNVVDTLTGDIYFNQATYTHQIKVPFQAVLDLRGQRPTTHPLYANLNSIKEPVVMVRTGPQWIKPVSAINTSELSFPLYCQVNGKTTGGKDTMACFIQQKAAPSKPEQATISNPTATNHQPKKTEEVQETEDEKIYRVELFKTTEQVLPNDSRLQLLGDELPHQEIYEDSTQTYTYTVGEEKNSRDLFPLYKTVKEKGFFEAQVASYQAEQLIGMDDILNLKETDHVKLRISNIYFESGSYQLSPRSYPVLDSLSSLLSQREDLIIEVHGHTDNQGEQETNQALSEQRALSVLKYLTTRHVEASRMKAKGFGALQPVTTNATPQGRAENRRIEFKISTRKP